MKILPRLLCALLLTSAGSAVIAVERVHTSKPSTEKPSHLPTMEARMECAEKKYVTTCTRQEIVLKEKGIITRTFDSSLIPKLPNGVFKANFETAQVVEVKQSNKSTIFYYLQFTPRDINDMAPGSMRPNYFAVLTDENLVPLKGMKVSQDGLVDKWFENQRNRKDRNQSDFTLVDHIATYDNM